MVAPAPNLQNFILQKQVLASGNVASGCRVKRVAPMTVTRIFLLKNVRVNGDWRYLSKIAMVLLKFKPDRVVTPRKCNQQPRVVKWNLILLYQGVGMLSFNRYSLILDYEY